MGASTVFNPFYGVPHMDRFNVKEPPPPPYCEGEATDAFNILP